MKETIKCILDDEHWPTKSDFNLNRKTLFKRTVIRPTIKIQQESNNIFRSKIDWESKKIHIKDALQSSFKEYVANLDLKSKHDATSFYKIINSLIRYKARGKIAKGIRQDDSIILEEQKRIIVTNYYESLFRDEEIKTINIYSNTFDFQ